MTLAYANVTGGNGGINGHYTFANGQFTRDDGNMASVKKTSGWDSCQAEGGIAEICGQASRELGTGNQRARATNTEKGKQVRPHEHGIDHRLR